MDACGIDDDVCPAVGDDLHCPCAIGGSIQRCNTLECAQPGGNPGGTCGEYVFSTVSDTGGYNPKLKPVENIVFLLFFHHRH